MGMGLSFFLGTVRILLEMIRDVVSILLLKSSRERMLLIESVWHLCVCSGWSQLGWQHACSMKAVEAPKGSALMLVVVIGDRGKEGEVSSGIGQPPWLMCDRKTGS
jgi:hypothetical protein